MPEINVLTSERIRAEQAVKALRAEWMTLTEDGRKVLFIEFGRVLGKEFAEISKKLKENK